MSSDVLSKIKNIIQENLAEIDLNSLSDEELFIDKGIDSLVRTDLFITVGEHFNIELMDVDENKISSLKKLADYIECYSNNNSKLDNASLDTNVAGKEKLALALKSLGIKQGDNLLVHGGLLNLGQIGGKSAEENLDIIYDALIEVLGTEGTLIVPAFYYEFARWDKSFDVDNDEPSTGLGSFSSYVVRKSNAKRSLHPLSSMAAVGKNATLICEGTCPTSYGVGSSWDKLFELNGKMLFLGVDLSAMTFVHYVEHRMGVPHIYNKLHNANVVKNGKELNLPICSSVRYLDFDIVYNKSKYTQIFSEAGLVKEQVLGKSISYLVSMKEAFNFIVDKLSDDVYFLLKNKPKFREGEIPYNGPAGELRE
jgi:aminoglycoside 3-N-acetyltransferase